MIYAVLSIIDSAVETYSRPVFALSVAQGVRSFTDEVNRAGSNDDLAKHPEDFRLVELGTFDDQTGRFDLLPDPRVLTRGKDVALRDVSSR